ncbi:MAG: recombinase family protein [Bacillota bacterium]
MAGTAIVYIRVSTEEQSKKGYSLTDQLEACTERAEEEGACDIVLCADEGESAAYLDRPGLQKALDLVRTRRYFLFVCLDADRLARDLGDQIFLTEEIEKYARLEFVRHRRGNPESPEDTLFYHVKGAVSQYERAKIRQRTVAGARQKAKSGKIVQPGGYPGHPGPYGYRYNGDPRNPAFEVVEEEAEVVRRIYRYVTEEGLGLGAVARRLNAERVPPPAGIKWYPSMVQRILDKKTYCGEFHNFAWRTRVVEGRTPSGRRRRRYVLRPAEERVAVSVPAIVTREQWEKAQEVRRANSLKTNAKKKLEYLLAGHLRCGLCGRALTSVGSVKKGPRYECISARGKTAVSCQSRSWPAKSNSKTPGLDEVIWEEIAKRLKDPSLIEKELQRVPRAAVSAVEKLKKELAKHQKHLSELQRHREGLFDLRLENMLSEPEFRRRLIKVDDKIETIRERIADTERRLALAQPPKMPDLKALTDAVCHKIDQADSNLKRTIIRKLDITVKVYPQRVEIFWPFECTAEFCYHTDHRDRRAAGYGRKGSKGPR